MSRCFSLTESKNGCYRSLFVKSGLRSTISDLKDGTTIHCWIPKTRDPTRPDLLLVHGLGVNALWQWGDVLRYLVPFFNIYIPDLLFFGDSFTTRPERTDAFQAQCIMQVMELNSVRKMSLVGLSYGGFVAYCMAAQYGDRVEKVAICGSGVCMEEQDLKQDLFSVSDLEEACRILVPQTPARLRELVVFTFSKPPPVGLIPSCLLVDRQWLLQAMCSEFVEERRDLIRAIPQGRKLSDLPKIEQSTMIICSERGCFVLKRHLGEKAQLVVIKNAGHAFNVEKTKEFSNHLLSFLVEPSRLRRTSTIVVLQSFLLSNGGENLPLLHPPETKLSFSPRSFLHCLNLVCKK